MWGPGVLPDGLTGRSYPGIVHLADWWPTFATLAGVVATDAGPPGFTRPDGVNQWPAFVTAAKGGTVAPADQPRTEVVIDLNPAYNNKGGVIIALRVGYVSTSTSPSPFFLDLIITDSRATLSLFSG